MNIVGVRMANPQPDRFIRVSVELFEAVTKTHMPGTARQVFDYLLRQTYGYQRKTFDTTQHKIAKYLEKNKQRVNEAILWLQDAKMINVTKNRDVLSRDCLTTFSIQKNYELWGTSRKSVTARKSVTLTSRKTVTSSFRKKKDKRGGVGNVMETCDVYRPPTGAKLRENGYPWIDAAAWNDFIQHRAEIKKSLTDLAVKKSIELLSGFKSRQREIIDTSIRCRWQGLFAPKTKTPTTDDVEGPRLRILEAPPDAG